MRKLPDKPPFGSHDIPRYFSGEILRNSEIKKETEEYNRRYLYWDELKYRIPEEDKRKAVWVLMKFMRQLRYEKVPYRYFDLHYLLAPEMVRHLHIFDQYLSGTLRIHTKAIRLEQSYIINSLMEEAIASSVLEGAATTRKAAKDMLRKGRKPRNDSEQMVVNNYMAMKYILKQKDEPLTPELILRIHSIVTEHTIDEAYTGRYRNNNEVEVSDRISGIVYHIPPDYTEIEESITELCRFANSDDLKNGDKNGVFIHPLIKAIVLHFLIGYIHPFQDGNGKTARSIFYWYVLRQGYWLFEYMPISRNILKSRKKYTLAYLYSEYDEMDITYFINYNFACFEEALHDLRTYLERKQSEQNATKAVITKIGGINQRQAGILRYIMEHSDEFLTIRQIQEMYDVVYETARSDLLKLEDLGYLIRKKRRKEFFFVFNEESNV